jgi:type I restriction enzyme R subunit
VVEDQDAYLAREARARRKIDEQLKAAGWLVQSAKHANVNAGPGVAVREFVLEGDHGRVDYLLFAGGKAIGVIEAKPEGATLVEVEHQAGKYVEGLPDWIQPPVYPLPFIYESTGAETRFTNGYDPDARRRPIFCFHRPETLIEWARHIQADPGAPRGDVGHAARRAHHDSRRKRGRRLSPVAQGCWTNGTTHEVASQRVPTQALTPPRR